VVFIAFLYYVELPVYVAFFSISAFVVFCICCIFLACFCYFYFCMFCIIV